MLVLAATLLVFVAWLASQGFLSAAAWLPPKLETYRYQADFRRQGENMLRYVQDAQGWQPVAGGLAVPPGSAATLSFPFDVDPPLGFAQLQLWARTPPGAGLDVDVLTASAAPVPLFSSRAACDNCAAGRWLQLAPWRDAVISALAGGLDGATYDLAPYVRRPGGFRVRVRATNHGGRPQIVLQEARVAVSGPFYATRRLRYLYLVPLPALLALGLSFTRWQPAALPAGACAALALFFPVSPAPLTLLEAAPSLFWLGLAGCVLAAIVRSRHPATPRARRAWPGGWAAYGVALAALAWRLSAVAWAGDGALEPDAQSYFGAAQAISLWRFFQPIEREPLFPFLAHAWFRLAGPSPLALRTLTVLCSALVVLLSYVAGRGTIGRVPSLVAALAVALNPFLQWNSTRGLREDASLALLLCLLIVLFARRPAVSPWAGFAAGVLAGGLLLLRFDLLAVLVALAALAAWTQRDWRRLPGPLALAVCAALVAPYLYTHWQAYGDPLYVTNLQARAFRNYEFHDQPGFPTTADMDRDQFLAGPPIGVLGYYFGLHTPQDLVVTTARGAVQIVKSVAYSSLPGAAPATRALFGALLVAGAFAGLFRPYRHLAVAGALLMLQYAFVEIKAFNYSHVDPYGGADPRLFMVGYPLLALCACALPSTALAVWRIAGRFRRRATPHRMAILPWPVRGGKGVARTTPTG